MTTKQCPDCGNDKLIYIRSQYKKLCADCGAVIPWCLHNGQEMIK